MSIRSLLPIPEIGYLLHCQEDIAAVVHQRSLKLFHCGLAAAFPELNQLLSNNPAYGKEVEDEIDYLGIDRELTFTIYDRAYKRGFFWRKLQNAAERFPVMK